MVICFIQKDITSKVTCYASHFRVWRCCVKMVLYPNSLSSAPFHPLLLGVNTSRALTKLVVAFVNKHLNYSKLWVVVIVDHPSLLHPHRPITACSALLEYLLAHMYLKFSYRGIVWIMPVNWFILLCSRNQGCTRPSFEVKVTCLENEFTTSRNETRRSECRNAVKPLCVNF